MVIRFRNMELFRLVFSPIDVNTYIIADGSGDCLIIDCGCYDRDEFKKLTDFMSEKHLRPVKLLNTHMHLDHLFGNKYMLEDFGLLTHACQLEEQNRKSAMSHAIMFGLQMDEPPEIGIPVADNDIISFNSLEIESIFVPGHTSGSIAFYIRKENCIFTGDALFAGSIGRTDLPGGDSDTLLNSIWSRLLVLDDMVKVYPGHGPSTSIGEEKRSNPFLI